MNYFFVKVFFDAVIVALFFCDHHQVSLIIRSGMEILDFNSITNMIERKRQTYETFEITEPLKSKTFFMRKKIFGKYEKGLKGCFYHDWVQGFLDKDLDLVIDELGPCDISEIAGDLEITKRELNVIVFLTLDFLGDETVDTIKVFVAQSIRARFLQKAFNESKKIFFDQFEEIVSKENTAEKRLEVKEDEISVLKFSLEQTKFELDRVKLDYKREIERELILQEQKNNKLSEELAEIKEKLKICEDTIDELKNNSFADSQIEDEQIDVALEFSDFQIILIGGHKELSHPNITCIDGQDVRFDLNILKSADKVFFNVINMSHSSAYRTFPFVKKNQISYGYVNSTNETLIMNEISQKLTKKRM